MGLSWLGEVNRLVCVTLSQVATILLVGGHVYSFRYPWGCWALSLSLPLLVSMVDGGRRNETLQQIYGIQ